MKNKFLAILLALSIGAGAAFSAPFKADAKTKRIPAGTKLKLQLIDSVNTLVGSEGDAFNAMLIEDQISGTSVILPAGSVIRGSISKIKPVKMLSRGAVLYLDFDHVVTPNGRQLPLSMAVCDRAKMTNDGGLYTSKGYGEAIQKNWARTVEITKNAAQLGSDLGDEAFNGGNYIMTPIFAIGGGFGGGAYLVGDSIIDLFRKGDDVILNKGSIVDVVITNPIDVPIN